MRVVCEFCQTVYNIPDAKLVRDVSQATCKVCRNKIVIRRDLNAVPSEESSAATTIRPPRGATPAGPSAAPTVAGPPAAGSPFNEEALPETELSSSWQEAIVDNRDTIAMLRKVGVRGPPDGSTATGGKVADAVDGGAPDEEFGDAGYDESGEIENGAADGPAPQGSGESPEEARTRGPGSRARPKSTRGRVTGFSSGGPSASAALSLLAAIGSGGAASMLVHNGAWGIGLSGLLAFAGCVFASTGSLLNAVVRRRGFIAVALLLIVAGVSTIAATGVVLATGGARTRALAAVHPFLEPLARIATDLER